MRASPQHPSALIWPMQACGAAAEEQLYGGGGGEGPRECQDIETDTLKWLRIKFSRLLRLQRRCLIGWAKAHSASAQDGSSILS